MRTPFLVLIGLLISYSFSTAQTSAVTSTGDEVILYEDGTWKYADGKLPSEEEIPVNSKKFKKDKSSTFLIESSRVDLGFYINPKKWSFNKDSDINSEAEYELRLKDGDLYGMIISEKFEMPLTTLRDLAVENGRKVAPDLRIVNEEYRTVNGLKVLWLRMDGSMQGIKFSYYGYYYSGEEGTVQFITYTAQNMLEDYRNDCETLLNGFVKTSK